VYIDILTLFPEMFPGPLGGSIVKRATERELVTISIHNIRDYTHNKHATTDDYPYGGGAGMVLKPEPVFEAVEAIYPPEGPAPQIPVILLSPAGRLFNQQIAAELAACPRLILICGHYEGIDERVRAHLVTDEISIGDYVLSGGEPAALVVVDAVVRLLTGVLGSADSIEEESHANGLLEYPQYTRPAVFRDWAVPDVLLSGNHAEIARWRRQQSLHRTRERRPDLLDKVELTPEDKKLLQGN
jgi:tRNA (guanine37-N1)-methyltransferase